MAGRDANKLSNSTKSFSEAYLQITLNIATIANDLSELHAEDQNDCGEEGEKREEGYNNDPNSLRFKWTVQGNTVFENYQVSHLRILGDDRFLPYGRSILDSARKVWKQLLMAEDAMLIYRISRAPERRVFYVDVGNIPPRDVDSYMQNARDKLKRIAVTSEASGNVDYRYNPESILEDFFIPVRGDRGIKKSSKILSGLYL